MGNLKEINSVKQKTPRARKIKGSLNIYTAESRSVISHIKSPAYKYTLLYAIADFLTTLTTEEIALFADRGMVKRTIATEMKTVIQMGESLIESIYDLFNKTGDCDDIINFYCYMLYGGIHYNEGYDEHKNYATHLSLSNPDLYLQFNINQIHENKTIYMSSLYATYKYLLEQGKLFNIKTFKEEITNITSLLEIIIRVVAHNTDFAKAYLVASDVEIKSLAEWSTKDLLAVNTAITARLIGVEVPKNLVMDVSNYNIVSLTTIEKDTKFFKFKYPFESILKHDDITSGTAEFTLLYLEHKKISDSSMHPFSYNMTLNGNVKWADKKYTRNKVLEETMLFSNIMNIIKNYAKPYINHASQHVPVADMCPTVMVYLSLFETIRQIKSKNSKAVEFSLSKIDETTLESNTDILAENLSLTKDFESVINNNDKVNFKGKLKNAYEEWQERKETFKINITMPIEIREQEYLIYNNENNITPTSIGLGEVRVEELERNNKESNEKESYNVNEKSSNTMDILPSPVNFSSGTVDVKNKTNTLQNDFNASSKEIVKVVNPSVAQCSVKERNINEDEVKLNNTFDEVEVNNSREKLINIVQSAETMQSALAEYYGKVNSKKNYTCEGVKTYLEVSKVLYEFR